MATATHPGSAWNTPTSCSRQAGRLRLVGGLMRSCSRQAEPRLVGMLKKSAASCQHLAATHGYTGVVNWAGSESGLGVPSDRRALTVRV